MDLKGERVVSNYANLRNVRVSLDMGSSPPIRQLCFMLSPLLSRRSIAHLTSFDSYPSVRARKLASVQAAMTSWAREFRKICVDLYSPQLLVSTNLNSDKRLNLA